MKRMLLAVASILFCDKPLFAQEQWAITDIGALAPDADFTVPTDMNSYGDVVGSSYLYNNGDPLSTFIWTCGAMAYVPKPAGTRIAHLRAINDARQIAGDATTVDFVSQAYRWTGAEIEVIPFLRDGDGSLAWGINNRGDVTGYSSISQSTSGPSHAFIWNEELLELPPVTRRDNHDCEGYDINDDGVVVGSSSVYFGTQIRRTAALWNGNVGVSLGFLPGDSASWATRVNRFGHAVGVSNLNGSRNFAVLWRDGQIIPITPVVPGDPQNFWSSEALDINDFDEVAGWGNRSGGGGNDGFVWREGQLTFMSSLTPVDFEWRLHPVAINNAGQLACRGSYRPDPFGVPERAFILTPPICRGFPTGDANCDGVVNNFDIDAFVLALTNADRYATDYAACNWLCNLDVNRDGEVNNFDIDPFVMLLSGG